MNSTTDVTSACALRICSPLPPCPPCPPCPPPAVAVAKAGPCPPCPPPAVAVAKAAPCPPVLRVLFFSPDRISQVRLQRVIADVEHPAGLALVALGPLEHEARV